MVGKIIGCVALGIGAFLFYIAMQPPDFNISRELVVNAPPEAVFPHINSSQKANTWMPWKDSDPEVQMNFSGPEKGIGSTSSWESKGQMGTGKAVVVESVPNQTVKTQLTYAKPMEMSQLAELSLSPTNEGTLVRWSVTGKNSFIRRAMCFFMDMDKMVGKEFDKGLAKLKNLVESTKTN